MRRSHGVLLERVRTLCLNLPEAAEAITDHHRAFQVRKKTFAYYLDNHHDDGILGLACKVLPDENGVLIAADPKRFYMPAYIGSRGWVGLRLDTGKVDWDEVAELVRGSHLLIAPKKLRDAGPH